MTSGAAFPPLELRRAGPEGAADFLALMDDEGGCGIPGCVAWWLDPCDGAGPRTDAERDRLRARLAASAPPFECHLLYVGGTPAACCLVGPLPDLLRLAEGPLPAPRAGDAEAWALAALAVAAPFRRRGFCRELFARVVADLGSRGVRVVRAYPRRGFRLSSAAGERWEGPERSFRAAGFVVVDDDPFRPVLEARPSSRGSAPA